MTAVPFVTASVKAVVQVNGAKLLIHYLFQHLPDWFQKSNPTVVPTPPLESVRQ